MYDFQHYLDSIEEFGIVEEINYPIVVVSGLPGVKPHEMILFETGERGEVFTLAEKRITVLLFSDKPVQAGTRAVRMNAALAIPVGDSLLGQSINPLGEVLHGGILPETEELRPIDTLPPGVDKRARIKRQFTTGTVIVDMMVPLGKGQKELVIGDRKTGKSAFLLTTLTHQLHDHSIGIYAAVGKKKNDLKQLSDYFHKTGVADKVVLVASSPDDSPGLIFETPYTAMTIAEYFRDQGRDVVIILDDLSTHAKFYREISLLAGTFPGRDSYPGDIFYTHARLLERAGNFRHTKGEVSITCLPVVETVEGDFTSYIATNVMGITDGHIFFDSNLFYNGRRPAVNTALSVTRVGKQTQEKAQRDITRELTSFFSLYEKMQNLSHFGSELTDNVKNILATGDKLYRFFNQHYSVIVPLDVQLILFCLIWLSVIDTNQDSLDSIRSNLIAAEQTKEGKLLFAEILTAESFNDLLHNISLQRDNLAELWKKRNG